MVVQQRAPGVAGIDCGRVLQIRVAVDDPARRADQAFADALLQHLGAQPRTADGIDLLPRAGVGCWGKFTPTEKP